MIHAEISIYPIGTNSTSASFYIAKAVSMLQDIKGLQYEVTSMGTLLEAENIDLIHVATKKMSEVVHNLGVNRVEIFLKIDSRTDKQDMTLKDKLDSIKKHLDNC